jgi:hydrogenase expression/formation protein
MTDLEGIANRMLEQQFSEKEITELLEKLYSIFKPGLDEEIISKLSQSIIKEVFNSRASPTDDIVSDVLNYSPVQLTAGEQGVGSRGTGDFVVHSYLTKMASNHSGAFLAPDSMDDAGAVTMTNNGESIYIVSKMEGMHSRLSNFPFIAGFHVTRACLRDVLVKGAKPVSIMVDIHLGDDSDIAKLFDFMAGVSCVAELAGVPITAGSTLRIGGDMVIGTRITGGIAAVGTCNRVLARRDILPDADIIMTEGAGGGTIATTAIYHSWPDVILYTLNVKFIKAMSVLLDQKEILEKIYCCSDVTNGGLRGDLFEILHSAGIGADVYETSVAGLVESHVKEMLDTAKTDYLGVSLDALLVFCEPGATEEVLALLRENSINAAKIGTCFQGEKILFHESNGETRELVPHFRESAYTLVKKIIGEKVDPLVQARMNGLVKAAFQSASEKKVRISSWISTHNQLE